MDSRIAPSPPPHPDAVPVESAPRPTPAPVRVGFGVRVGGAAVQAELNAQNRAFSALSKKLETEHDTVKTAIGNIR